LADADVDGSTRNGYVVRLATGAVDPSWRRNVSRRERSRRSCEVRGFIVAKLFPYAVRHRFRSRRWQRSHRCVYFGGIPHRQTRRRLRQPRQTPHCRQRPDWIRRL